MCECAKSLRCKYHREILVFFKLMCMIQLNYAYSREREHDVYIEMTSFIYCWYFIQKIFLNQLSPYKPAHKIDNQLITLLNINFSILLFVETAMGISINALSQPNSEYIKAVKE